MSLFLRNPGEFDAHWIALLAFSLCYPFGALPGARLGGDVGPLAVLVNVERLGAVAALPSWIGLLTLDALVGAVTGDDGDGRRTRLVCHVLKLRFQQIFSKSGFSKIALMKTKALL